ncbi:MAG: lytic transglycosylase domain-containing protein [Bacteroidales bacterium]|nr:lytic transglycosylase domain-containing protein [Bacteroidales bacterium]
MRRIVLLILLIVIIPIIFSIFIFHKNHPGKPDDEYKNQFKTNNKYYSVPIPEKVDFAGENVPVNFFDVRERLDRELIVNTYWQSNTILMLKRAYRWFPIIEPILKANKLPDDFKYLALIESGFEMKVSPAGAAGFWQFIKETGKKYGLEINEEVDQRYDLPKATEAACKYLKEAFFKYNSWTIAAASYNLGMGGISRQLERQKVDNYYDLFLTDETSRYIFRILALKIIYKNPTEYGFYLRKKDLYPVIPTYTIEVDTSILELADFAFSQKINYKILKYFNPWLRQPFLKNKDKKKYNIILPKDGFLSYDQLMQELIDPDSLRIGN